VRSFARGRRGGGGDARVAMVGGKTARSPSAEQICSESQRRQGPLSVEIRRDTNLSQRSLSAARQPALLRELHGIAAEQEVSRQTMLAAKRSTT